VSGLQVAAYTVAYLETHDTHWFAVPKHDPRDIGGGVTDTAIERPPPLTATYPRRPNGQDRYLEGRLPAIA
jgi:hypothetical protein